MPDYFQMARGGTLPPDFDQWELAKEYGWTVAHEAACYGNLPKDFDRWELADKDGETVAHVVARWGNLPEGFDRWELADNNGDTVRDVYERKTRRSAMTQEDETWKSELGGLLRAIRKGAESLKRDASLENRMENLELRLYHLAKVLDRRFEEAEDAMAQKLREELDDFKRQNIPIVKNRCLGCLTIINFLLSLFLLIMFLR